MVAIGAQVVVDKAFRGKGISKGMLQGLCNLIYNRFDYIFSSVSKINQKAYAVHLKEGWKVVSEDQTH